MLNINDSIGTLRNRVKSTMLLARHTIVVLASAASEAMPAAMAMMRK